MSTDSEILFFEDDTLLQFAEVENTNPKSTDVKWKILIVDDESEIHKVTKMALAKLKYEDKTLEFISAYSGAEAKNLFRENPDTAVILLDVVMEDDDSGLKVIKYIREDLENKLVRIILRTGQPGQAPEEKIIIDYDINDYKEKTELTTQKLFTAIISALRSYRDITTINDSSKGLRNIIDSSVNIFEIQTIQEFSARVLTSLTSILDLEISIPHYQVSGFAAIKRDEEFIILAAIGRYSKDLNMKVQNVVPNEIKENFDTAYKYKKNIYFDNHLIIFLKSKLGTETLIYFESYNPLTQLNKELLDVFCSNIYAINEAIINSSRSADIENLLNNAGQGFLTFKEDLLVDEEYSLECVRIFEEEIKNKKFPEILFSSIEQREYMQIMLLKILQKKDESLRDIYIPLLPSEVVINGKHISLNYKVIDKTKGKDCKSFMVILTDVTAEKSLENKIEEERKILKMVVNAFTNHDEFMVSLKDYHKFCSTGITELLESRQSLKEIVYEIFRIVHTFKGNFSQMEMVNIVKRLHDFETSLFNLKDNLNGMTSDDFKKYLSDFNMIEWLNMDINILNGILGDQFFKKEKVIFVDQAKLIEIEKKITSLPPSDVSKLLLSDVKKLRLLPFSDLLKSYSDYVIKISKSFQKPLNPLVIEGEDVFVDVEKYHNFTRTLVHVFRNSIDHGIEPTDERIRNGKNEYGNIKCSVKCINRHIHLSISDDGKGLDLDRIRELAINKGIYDKKTAFTAHDSEIIALIFKEEITTKKNVTEYSGRGIGLTAVIKELKKIGGTVEVATKAGKGTEFSFLLPYVEL